MNIKYSPVISVENEQQTKWNISKIRLKMCPWHMNEKVYGVKDELNLIEWIWVKWTQKQIQNFVVKQEHPRDFTRGNKRKPYKKGNCKFASQWRRNP